MNRASEDSAGLLAYYNEHKQDFNLKKRAVVRTITVDNAKQAASIYKILQANKTISDEACLKNKGLRKIKLTGAGCYENKTQSFCRKFRRTKTGWQ